MLTTRSMSSPYECKAQTPEVSTVLLLESEDCDVNENHVMAQWSTEEASADPCETSLKPEPEKHKTAIEFLYRHPRMMFRILRLILILDVLIVTMVVATTSDTWVLIIGIIWNVIMTMIYMFVYLGSPSFQSRYISRSGTQSV